MFEPCRGANPYISVRERFFATIQPTLRPQIGNLMDQLEQLKAKYKSVLEFIKQSGVHLAHLNVQDNKLLIQGAAPSEQIKNEVWNRIKATDSAYGDLTCDLTVDSSLPQPHAAASSNATTGGRTYKVQPGDTLSKIAKEFYGNANDYNRIFAANRDKLENPDKIQAGQELVIPS
jgi:LysM repeat protein